MPFLIDFEGGFRPNLDVITEGSIVRNGIIGDFRFLVHPVAHLHGDGVRQKLRIALSSWTCAAEEVFQRKKRPTEKTSITSANTVKNTDED